MKRFLTAVSLFVFVAVVAGLLCFPASADVSQQYSLVPDGDVLFKITSTNGTLAFNEKQTDIVSFNNEILYPISYTAGSSRSVENFYRYSIDISYLDHAYRSSNNYYTCQIGLSIPDMNDDNRYNAVTGVRLFIGAAVQSQAVGTFSVENISFAPYSDPISGSDVEVTADYGYIGRSWVPNGDSSTQNIRMYKVRGVFNSAGPESDIRLFGMNLVYVFVSFTVNDYNSDKFDIFLSFDSYVTAKSVDINAGLSSKAEELDDKADEVLSGMAITTPNVGSVNSELEGDASVVAPVANFLAPDYENNRFISLIVGCGVSSLSLAFLGFILYGKKSG